MVRYLLVWLMALSFVVSGAAWRHCLALQPAAPAHAAVEHRAHAAVHNHVHGDHQPAHRHAADVPLPAPNDDLAGSKCCSICTVAGVMTPTIASAIFTVSFVTFSRPAEHCVGHIVRIDPGIPKRIA